MSSNDEPAYCAPGGKGGKSTILPAEQTKDGAALEREHVMAVYDSIASQWDGTRYKPWPRVAAFIASQPAGSLIADSGAGNGKNLAACREAGHLSIGSDFSVRACPA